MDNIKPTQSFFLDTRREKKDGLFPVKLTLYFGGEKKRYYTGVDITKSDWEKLNRINQKEHALKSIKRTLNVIAEKANTAMQLADPFSFVDFEQEFFQEKKIRKSADLAEHFDEYINFLNGRGRVGTADSYKTSRNSLLAFRPKLRITDITVDFLEAYEQALTAKGSSPTTIGIYVRQLRRIINLAIEKGVYNAQKYPFKKYAIPSSRNIKKALSIPHVKQLLEYQTDVAAKRKALDFWLFSYLSNGMNMTDICQLPSGCIGEDFFYYYRAKTMHTKKKDLRPIKVPLTDRSRAIIERWKGEAGSHYLFPILQPGLSPRQIKYKVQDFVWKVNKEMRGIAQELGIGEKINTYAARHSHATILKRKGAPTEVIRENLGHSSLAVTENYLDDFTDDVKKEYAKMLTDL